jgi:Immunity protein 26
MTKPVPKPGDCFELTLPDGRFAYVQYLCFHDQYGSLVRVFDLVTTERQHLKRLGEAGYMFEPVFVGLKAAIAKGGWLFVGQLALEDFKFPRFRYTHSTQPGVHENWKLWDGKCYTHVGKLAPADQALELLCVWGYQLLEQRILNGGKSPRAELLK